MRLVFIGENGSMGLINGCPYNVRFKQATAPYNKPFQMIQPVICPYESDVAFWKNWAPPNEYTNG